MNKRTLKDWIGKPVRLHWRDPQSGAEWTKKPLKHKTAEAWTLGVIKGFNEIGELVIAASAAKKESGDVTAIRVESVTALEPIRFGKKI